MHYLETKYKVLKQNVNNKHMRPGWQREHANVLNAGSKKLYENIFPNYTLPTMNKK